LKFEVLKHCLWDVLGCPSVMLRHWVSGSCRHFDRA